ncbi:MAG: hypothetical protein PVH87_18355 [Desulfobacteraceae bacterium]|jgi:hypothetical protein
MNYRLLTAKLEWHGPAIPTECHLPQQTQVQGFSKNYFLRIILFLSIFSIPIPIAICRGLVIGVGIEIGIEIAIGIDFLFLNTVQLELLEMA